MVSLLKGIFGKRELTDPELYSAYKNSPKTVKDFEKYIMSIKEGKETVALKEIYVLNISKFKELDELIEILEKNNIDKGISLSTNRDKKKLNSIYNQLKAVSHIQKNFIQNNDDIFFHFIFSNKFELFIYLRKNYEKNKNPDFFNYICDTYFNKENYLIMLEYFLLKESENDINFLLPNENNYIQLQLKNSIPIYANLSDTYYNLDKQNESTNKINNLLLNIIIYFYVNHKNDFVSNNLDKYIIKRNIEYIDIILSLYKLAKKTDPEITLLNFLTNKNLFKNFSKISSVDNNTFSYVFNNIMSNVREYSNIYKGLKYLPLELIRDMIINRMKYDYINKAIDIVINSNEYNNTSVFNFVLKYLFEYYCFNKVSLNQFRIIVNYLSKYNDNFSSITNQLDLLLEVIDIFQNKDVEFLISELLNDDMNDLNPNNTFIIDFLDYLKNISEERMKDNKFDFIDLNIIDLNKLISYKKGLTYGKILLYFFDKNTSKRNIILNVISSNKNIILNQNEIKSLIDLYLLNPYLIKTESISFIESFLDDEFVQLSPELNVKLENLLEYLKIKKYIQKYKIDDSVLKDYSLENYSQNIREILELLLIKTTDVNKIQKIDTFLNSENSKDMQNSLKLGENKYYYYLFIILMKYQLNSLANEIIDLFLKNKEIRYFNKSMDYIYNNYCKKDNNKFRTYCKNSNFEEYLLENNKKYLDILIEDNDFSSDEKMIFPLERKPNDVLLLYSLIKNNKIQKELNKSCNDLFNSFDDFNKLPNENKNLKSLVENYYKNQEDDKDNNAINYNYSLHPKLVTLLKSQNYYHLIEELKITFRTKIKIYNFCITNNLCSLNDIINIYESIKLKKKAKTDKEIVEQYKILFNLYKEKDENNSIYKELCNFIKNNYDNEQNMKSALLLIDFNLSNKLYITYNNLLFLNIFFNYKISSSSEKELNLLRLLSLSNHKINILPFCSDFNDIYINNKKYQDIMDKYYKNNFIISVKENNAYFEELKKDINSYPNLYYQSLELFNLLNIGNSFNIKNILSHLFENNKKKSNFKFLFIYRITINFLSINCSISNRIEYGLNNLLGIFNSLHLNIEDINKILEEIFFFQSISFINNSSHNILYINENYQTLVKKFIEAKEALVDRIIKMYYDGKISNNLLYSQYKIFLVKCHIIKEAKYNEVSNIYNTIKNMNDYKEISDEIVDNLKLKGEIYDIYTKL